MSKSKIWDSGCSLTDSSPSETLKDKGTCANCGNTFKQSSVAKEFCNISHLWEAKCISLGSKLMALPERDCICSEALHALKNEGLSCSSLHNPVKTAPTLWVDDSLEVSSIASQLSKGTCLVVGFKGWLESFERFQRFQFGTWKCWSAR